MILTAGCWREIKRLTGRDKMILDFFRNRKIKSLKIRIAGLEGGIIGNKRCGQTDPYAYELLWNYRKELLLLESKDKLITTVRGIIDILPKNCNDSPLGEFITSLENELRQALE